MTDDPPDDELARTLLRLAQSVESLRTSTSPPAWAEINGPVGDPTGLRWHDGVETLIGFVAPPDCSAIAVVANGWGHGRGGPPAEEEGPIPPGEHRRIRVVCLVTRSGQRAGYMRIGGDIAVHGPPEQGRVLDSLLRSFGLATAPPAESPDRVLAVMWLAEIEHRAETSTGRLTWASAAALHPAMQVLARLGKAVPLDQVSVALRAAGRVWTWSYLADAVADELLPPGVGEWMDDGMVSRWLTDALPDLDVILGRVRALVPSAVTRRLRSVLDQLDLLDEGSSGQTRGPEEGT